MKDHQKTKKDFSDYNPEVRRRIKRMANPGFIAGSFGEGVGSSLDKLMFWGAYGFIGLIVLGAVILIFYFTQFRYKVYIFERRAGVNDIDHSIGKIRSDRAKEVKEGGIDKWQLLFSRKKIEPIKFEYIFPGNNVFLYRTGKDVYIPIDFKVTNKNAMFDPLPQDTRFWEQLEIQQIAMDYKDDGWMAKFGAVTVLAGTILFCVILCGVTIWWSYEHANQIANALYSVSANINNVNVIPGTPGQ